ncbi:Integrase catalytic domain-containing protein (Fragment), partial [Durusdinium trenchii]
AEKMLALVLTQAIRLRIRPRSWLSFQDSLYMEESTRLLDRAFAPCQHERIQRYGNRHGAAAFAIAFNCHQLPRQDVYPSSPHGHCGTSEVYSSRYPVIAELSIGPTKDFAFTDQGQEATQLTGSGVSLKPGNKTWLTGHLRQVHKILQKEVDIYESLPSHVEYKKGPKIDLLEVYAGRALVSEMCPAYGLSSLQPIDLIYGWDLHDKKSQQALFEGVDRFEPLLLMVEWSCTQWSIFNQNMNYSTRPEALQALRDADRPLVELGAELCAKQRDSGRLYLGENPLRSALWNEPDIRNLRDHPDNYEAVCDAGAYGAETQDGWPIQKPHRWITNSEILAKHLSHKMTDEQKQYTKTIEGKDTKPSGQYGPGLAHAILTGLREEARFRNPQRFHMQYFRNNDKQKQNKQQRTSKVYYNQPSDDRERWNQVLEEIERRFTNTYKRPFYVNERLDTDIWFENVPPMTKQMQTSIARLHCNLGHASKAEIVRILAAAGKLDSKLLSALDALRCGSCQRMTKTVKPPPSSTATMKYSGAFGDHLQTDIIYIRLLSGEAVPVLGMVCMSTNYHAAKTLLDRTPQHVLDTMHEIWYRPFGLPLSVQTDADGAYLSQNQEWHQGIGIEYTVHPAEEAWRLGKIGRRNALMRTLAERLIDQNGTITRHQLNHALTAVLFSMNTSTYSYGRSPSQAVFGRVPRPIGDLISDQQALAMSPQVNPELLGLQPELLRAEALTALAQFSASQAVRRSLLRKTCNQQDLSHLQPGQAVAYWRQAGKARQHKRGAWQLSRFLAWDPDRKSAWLQVGKHSIRVGTTQLRPAAGWENWTPRQEDIDLIRQAEHNMSTDMWMDDTGDAPEPDVKASMEDEIFQFRPLKAARLHHPEQSTATQASAARDADDMQEETAQFSEQAQPFTLATIPAAAASANADNAQQPQFHSTNVHQQAAQQNINIHNTDQRLINVHVDSPTYQQFGPNVHFGPMPPTPRAARGRSRSRGRPDTQPLADKEQRPASDAEQRPAPETPALEDLQTSADAEATAEPHAAPPEPTATAEADGVPTTTASAPADSLYTQFDIFDDNTMTLRAPHWDGSPDLQSPLAPSKRCYKAYLASSKRKQDLAADQIHHDPARSDSESSDDDLMKSNTRHLTRQEIKQLDRELPWREIVAMPKAAYDKFVEAASHEYTGWMQWSTIKPLTLKRIQEIRNDPVLRRRILKSRVAYKDKSKGQGQLRAKARTVLIGRQDPDLKQLTRDSPTPTRLSEMVVMSIATAGANCQFNQDGRRWHMWISDAEKAFLQGQQDSTERQGLPIFMEPPSDPIIKDAGAYPCELYEVVGN